MTNLLFPTDFSNSTEATLDWARLFAHKTGATITLLHVQQPIIPDTTLPTIADPGLGVIMAQEVEDISRQRLENLATTLQAEGLSVTTEWRLGSVEDEILDAAQAHSADLIVMGRSDLSTFFARLSGSAVTDVADEARCPVLIVPITEEDKAIRPAQVRTIAYAMQSQTTQDLVSTQTASLLEAFDAELTVLTEDKLETVHTDLIVMQLYPKSGFLDEWLHPNHVSKLIEKSDVPVLVYHEKK
ncbi:universal stress protein [Spirosoma sp. BT702]|uniref:Universal stress protein n=1 Tax=Spirosoma profusum TaxID=2771354 RepID=A0A927AS45_9BACT|nr:universal stress protein [Spirosoma profusum]MBD2703303.1 universal stress protein [Spirosoma profusum]